MAPSLSSLLDNSFRTRAAAPALECEGQSLLYSDLQRRADAFAALLRDRGVSRGDRIVVGLPNSVGLVASVLGTLRTGAVLVPLNPASSEDEVRYILGDAMPAAALLHDGHAPLCDEDRLLPVGAATAGAGTAGAGTAGAGTAGAGTAGAGTAGAGTVSADCASVGVDVDPADPALMVYTSGTTGRPKGVVLSHGALGTNLTTVAEAWGWTEADRLLLTLPCFHMHGLGLGLLASFCVGSCVLLRPRFVLDSVLDDLDRNGATMFFGVPTIYNRLVSLPVGDVARARLSRMRLWVSGSAPLGEETFRRFEQLFGQKLMERYGMTECGFVLSTTLAGPRRAGSVGVPLTGVDLRIVDPEQADAGRVQDVARGAEGELLIRGPNLFSGYWRQTKSTASAFLDGYLRSGDLVRIDEEGLYRIVGRISVDIIKTRGFKVGALEIENTLLKHPAVQEVAVVGVADADQGQRIVAAVTLHADVVGDEAAAEGALLAFSRQYLAPHKVPGRFVMMREIPKTGPGKFKKSELIERLQARRPS